MWNDFLLAFRTLVKSPEHAIIALITLALGIGTTTAMYNLADALIFRSSPFPNGREIVRVLGTSPTNAYEAFSEPDIPEILRQASSLSEAAVYSSAAIAIGQPGQPPRRRFGINASPEIFSVTGVYPTLGRSFTKEECHAGAGNLIVLTHSYWVSAFAGDRNVVGRTVRVDGETYTVIGVMPPAMEYSLLWGTCDFIRPLVFSKDQIGQRDYRVFNIIGRLKPGVSPKTVAAELAPLAARQAKDFPSVYLNRGYRTPFLQDSVLDELGRTMTLMLLALSGVVLLIACANLANLQLVRALANVRDLSIRSALGASRFRLIRLQLAECILIAIGGGLLGLALAFWISDWMQAEIRIGVSSPLDLRMNIPTFVAAAVISIAAGILFGILPAWLASRTDVNATLKQQARGSTTGRGHHWIRNGLIISQICLAFVLLSGAAVMLNGLNKLLAGNGGWATDKVLTSELTLPETRYTTPERRIEFFKALEQRLRELPEVEHVGLSTGLPIYNFITTRPIVREGEPEAIEGAVRPIAHFVHVSSDFFATMGIERVEGRLFPENIRAEDPQYIVINEALAKRFWPEGSAIGKRIGRAEARGMVYREVIGVVKNVSFPGNPTRPETDLQIYRPLVQEPWSYINIVLNSRQPATLVEPLRKAVAEVDPDLPVDEIFLPRQSIERMLHNLILVIQTLTGFSVLGLILASVGLYGVISNTVSQRAAEFGIRLALGATPRKIVELVVRYGATLLLGGMILGSAGSYVISRILRSTFTRIAPLDLSLGVALFGLLLVVTMLAVWLPARRATRVDPMIALRAE